nr:hypothetical protein [uncultured Bacteroides sp.]
MGEYGREQRSQLSRAIANNKTGSRQLKGIVDNRPKKRIQNSIIQKFAIPPALPRIANDVNSIIEDMGTMGNEDEQIPGSIEWAEDSRSAAMRKLNEWDALKMLVQEPNEVPRFGTDDVTEPDAYRPVAGGGMTDVVENKYITGKRDRITANVHDAITQLITGSRPRNYYGKLFARIQLSKYTFEDLRANSNAGGMTRMQNGWNRFATTLKDKATIQHNAELWIQVLNFPLGDYNHKLLVFP